LDGGREGESIIAVFGLQVLARIKHPIITPWQYSQHRQQSVLHAKPLVRLDACPVDTQELSNRQIPFTII
jgi:hypothetical protein